MHFENHSTMKALRVFRFLLLISLWLMGVQSQMGSKCWWKKAKTLSNGEKIGVVLDQR